MNTLDKIVHTAKDLFTAKGFSSTQMKEVASSAEINRRTLYRYFPTKEELIFHIYIEAMRELNAYLNSVADDVKGDNGFEKFRNYLTHIDIQEMSSFMIFIAQFDNNIINLLSDEKINDEMKIFEEPQNYRLYNLICEGIEDGSIRNDLSSLEIFMYLSHSFMAMYQRIILQQFDKENNNEINYEKLFITMTLDGLKRTHEKDTK